MKKSSVSENINRNNAIDSALIDDLRRQSMRLTKLNPSMSLRAIGARGKAAARSFAAGEQLRKNVAVAPQKSPKTKTKAKAKVKPNRKAIDVAVETIRRRLAENIPAGYDIREVKGAFTDAAYQIIEVHERGMSNDYICNNKVKPIIMMAFYTSVYDRNELGSVTIYGDDMFMLKHKIVVAGSFFGVQYKSISIERGLRPFIEVHFRA